jgi:protein-tyrosine phosphatase
MIDIHCHLLPGLDDGPQSWDQSLSMARMAWEDGIHAVIATPHQLGNYRSNTASDIRTRVSLMREHLSQAQIPLTVYPGADVRIEPDLANRLRADDVLTLADQHRHVLLELPHELCFPLASLLEQLRAIGITGILSHPERNHGIMSDSRCLEELVEQGCLMQITAGSLLGRFGKPSQRLAETMLRRGLVHLLASDGHGTERRRPVLRTAYKRVSELTDHATAHELCEHFPSLISAGQSLPLGRRRPTVPRRWFSAIPRG